MDEKSGCTLAGKSGFVRRLGDDILNTKSQELEIFGHRGRDAKEEVVGIPPRGTTLAGWLDKGARA